MGSRGISGRVMPPKGSIRCRIASNKLRSSLCSVLLKAFFSITRASSSIERPCVAARMRRRFLVFSSTFRIRIVAMLSMITWEGARSAHQLLKSGGSRMGSRGISGSVTPPSGAKICLIAVPSPTCLAGFGSSSAFFRISRASSSMERPWWLPASAAAFSFSRPACELGSLP